MSRNRNRGWASLIVIAIMLLLFTLCITTISLGKSQKKASVDHFNKIQAYYYADAGVEEIVSRIISEPGWVKDVDTKGGITLIKEANRQVNLERKVDEGYDSVIINSKGLHKNGLQILDVEILLEKPLDFSKGVWVETICGSEIPEFRADFYANRAVLEYISDSDDPCELNLDDENDLDGIVYCEGDLNLGGDYTGMGTIVATGDIKIFKDLKPKDGISVLTIVTPASVSVESCWAECLIYAGKDLLIKNGSQVFGSIIAGNMDISEDSSFFFFEEWGNIETETVMACFEYIEWKEVYSD